MTASRQNTVARTCRQARDRLLEILRDCRKVVVAFSGGISTVVARAAFDALGEQACAVTADSASVPRAEIAEAKKVWPNKSAASSTASCRRRNSDDPNYLTQRRQPLLSLQERTLRPDRIAACRSWANPIVCSGGNLDDNGDYRPSSSRLPSEHAVRHPLPRSRFHERPTFVPWPSHGTCPPGINPPRRACRAGSPGCRNYDRENCTGGGGGAVFAIVGFSASAAFAYTTTSWPASKCRSTAWPLAAPGQHEAAGGRIPRAGLPFHHARSRKLPFRQSQCPR